MNTKESLPIKVLTDNINTSTTRKKKKGKGSKRSKHITNCKSKIIKTIMGAQILNRLGTVQQDTQDMLKRKLLKEIPLSKFIEVSTGNELPDYQKRLLDLHQARHEAKQSNYEPDAGPLTDEQTEIIHSHSPETNIPASNFSQGLFHNNSAEDRSNAESKD